jgi:hypothetical protein
MAQIEISEEQKKTILTFLSRVELKGAEVPAFNNAIAPLIHKQNSVLNKNRIEKKEEAKK